MVTRLTFHLCSCSLMKNAFNPEEETERDWDLELADDVKGECEDKYGKVLDIYVVKESSEVRHAVLSRAQSCAIIPLTSMCRLCAGRDLH